jgi:HAD superfamily hydrolase (TIGR01548 family)
MVSQVEPEVIIFDVDGVLVDARASFHRSALQTVEHFTGKRATAAELHRWKLKPGYNDDWKLATDWVNARGVPAAYEDVKAKFIEYYAGHGRGGRGNANREKWIAPRGVLRRLGRRFELAVFTGRIQQEFEHTLRRFRLARYFRQIVTSSDVPRSKPYPDGLLRILRGRDPQRALYLGDNVDDAAAGQAARVPFVGVLGEDVPHRRTLAARLRELGALHILTGVGELERWLA